MKRKIQDYLPLYLKSKVVTNSMREDIVCDIVSVNNSGGHISGVTKDGKMFNRYGSLKDVKLLLRPLSDMTDKEYDELEALSTEKMEKVKKKNFEFDFYFQISGMTLYLLAKGFDIFELIKDGLAIDKTKFNK